MKNLVTMLFISASVFIFAVIACFVMTPLWWKLESILEIELAGHSGPNETVLFGFAGFFAILSFILLLKFSKKIRSHESH